MAMPDEFTLDFDQLEMIIIHLAYDFRRPVFREQA
jgi:hypothetical protein